MNKKFTVYIIDDEYEVRESISLLIRSIGLKAESFSSIKEYLDFQNREDLGCIVLDLRMARMSGLEFLRKRTEFNIQHSIIMISGHGDIPIAVEAMQNGAIDFIEKPINPQRLIESINKALLEYEICLKDVSDDLPVDGELTDREKEIFELLVYRKTSKQIGKVLGISFRTVEVHRKNILSKLNLKSLQAFYKKYGEV